MEPSPNLSHCGENTIVAYFEIAQVDASAVEEAGPP